MSDKHKQLLLNVFIFIYNFMEKNKYTPSYEEIGEALNMSSAYISRLVSELIEIGLLERPRDRALVLGKMSINEWLNNI